MFFVSSVKVSLSFPMESDTRLQKHSSLSVSVITRVERNDQLISLNRFLFILMEVS